MYCELISTVVILLINIYPCQLVLTIMLRCAPCVVRIGIIDGFASMAKDPKSTSSSDGSLKNESVLVWFSKSSGVNVKIIFNFHRKIKV
jgi:hypothetical protein